MPGNAAIGNLAVNLSLETAAFTDGATKAQTQMRALGGEAQRMAHGFGSFNSNANNARVVSLELAHVTRSLAEQMANGVSPVKALTMEIGRIATAAQYAGGPAGLAKMAFAAATVNPIITALAGAAAIGAGALVALKSTMNDSGTVQNYIKSLNLTEKQMKKLKDASVSYGDIMKGVWNTVADHTGADKGIAGFKKFAIEQFKLLLKAGVDIFSQLYGDIVGTYRATIVIWKNFPAALGDLFYSGVNAAIVAINSLIQKSVGGINGFIHGANSILGAFGIKIGDVIAPQLQQIGNQYAGAAKTVANAINAETTKATAQARAAANSLIGETLRNIYAATEDRIKTETAAVDKSTKAHKQKTKALKDEAAAFEKLLKNLAGYLNAAKFDVSTDLLHPKVLGKIDTQPDQLLPQGLDHVKSAWEEWASSVPQQAGEIANAFEGIATRGLDSISGAIADVVTGAKSLGQAFGEVARGIVSEIIQMTSRMLIFKLISGVLGGSQFDYASFNQTVADNNAALSAPMVHFANGGSGVFGGFGGVDQNVLSLNGSPIARVSRGEQFNVAPANSNAPGRVVVELRDEMLDARIATGANVQLVRAYPAIQAGVTKSIAERQRRR